MGEYVIRRLEPGDEASLLETFNHVFAIDRPDFRPRSAEQWQWAFRRNPSGTRVYVALHQGDVVAQYAALPYRVSVDGRDSCFAQTVDSMVHPAHNRGLKHPGLFVRTALAYFDEYGGAERDLVYYGWPLPAAWRVSQRYFDGHIVRTQPALVREPGTGPREMPPGVERLERFDGEVERLYERCRSDWGASTVRDASFMNWRYVDHPTVEYVPLGVRADDGSLRGVAIYRFDDWLWPDMGMVVDWLVPPAEREAGELLHEAVQARARGDGALTVAAIFPEWSPWFVSFQEWAWRVCPTDLFLIARSYDPRYDALWLRESWWMQLGDSDLV